MLLCSSYSSSSLLSVYPAIYQYLSSYLSIYPASVVTQFLSHSRLPHQLVLYRSDYINASLLSNATSTALPHDY